MKQFSSFLLICTLLLCFTGCSQEPSENAKPEKPTIQQEQGEESDSSDQKEDDQADKPVSSDQKEDDQADKPDSSDQKEDDQADKPDSSDQKEDNQADKPDSSDQKEDAKEEKPDSKDEGYQSTSGNLAVEKDKNFIDYQEKAEPMTQKEAKEYLAKEEADVSEPEYRQAVFTVNSSAAQEIIEEAGEAQEITPEVQQLFDGIAFRFIEGDTFASSTVKSALLKLGTCEKKDDGIYTFTFYDRTLPQATVNQEGNSHSINAYSEVLNLLLNDPNVEVLVQQ